MEELLIGFYIKIDKILILVTENTPFRYLA